MSTVAARIQHLEAHIETIIAEIASLKIATGMPPDVTRYAPQAAVEPVKELYVLYDFETNGKMPRVYVCSAISSLILFFSTGLGKTDGIRICQVGAVALDQNMREIATFNEFVNPLVAIDPGATAVNGINADFVSKKPGWDIVGRWFNNWIEEHRGNGIVNLVGHNAKR